MTCQVHVRLTRAELAEVVAGLRAIGNDALADRLAASVGQLKSDDLWRRIRSVPARQWLARLNQGQLQQILGRSRVASLAVGNSLSRRARHAWAQQALWLQIGGALLAMGAALAVVLYLAYLPAPPPMPASPADRAPVLAAQPAVTLQPTRVALAPLPSTAAPRAAATPVPLTATSVPPTITPVPTPVLATPASAPTPTLDLPDVPVRLRLVDQGGTPIMFDPALGAFRQDLDDDGTNVYVIGDVFVDPRDDREWTWVGGVTFVSSVGTLTLDAFR